MKKIQIIDSHTGGEPTRTVVGGGPPLVHGPLKKRLDAFRADYDRFRSAIVNEPRGSEAMVGALLCEPVDRSCAAGVIFFNNVGYLGMCGHGTIGLVATLFHLGRIAPGTHRIETPVGVVSTCLHESGEVTVTNVPSYRTSSDVQVEVESYGAVVGEVAWGGNWFFLTGDCPLPLIRQNVEALSSYCWSIRQALKRNEISGPDGEEIDHIEISGPPTLPTADSKNFVLCPGKSYDRSPCGTGTSAKVACLHAAGKLNPGGVWRQQSITDSLFEASISLRDGMVIPHIKGSAYVNGEAVLLVDEQDPLGWGMR